MTCHAHPVGDIREDEAGEQLLELGLELLEQRPRMELHEGIAQDAVHAVDVPGVRPERVMDARKSQPCAKTLTSGALLRLDAA